MAFLRELPVLNPDAFTNIDADTLDAPCGPTYRYRLPVVVEEALTRDEPVTSTFADDGAVRGWDFAMRPDDAPQQRASFLVRRFYALAAKRADFQNANDTVRNKRPWFAQGASEDDGAVDYPGRKRSRTGAPVATSS